MDIKETVANPLRWAANVEDTETICSCLQEAQEKLSEGSNSLRKNDVAEISGYWEKAKEFITKVLANYNDINASSHLQENLGYMRSALDDFDLRISSVREAMAA